MKKRDSIKGMIPTILGGVNFIVLDKLYEMAELVIADELLWFTLTWVTLTAVGIYVCNQGLDLFDNKYSNQNEESGNE
ncbi:MAG: hypothetical protein GY823_12085 [Flavobacteriaceae bacterium]|nr:hypothetical protein [Flavobacteriaceae bacterium]